MIMEQKLELWYRKSAGCPEEALPIGNGHLGALIFGHGERETLALNDDTLWSGYKHDKNRPSAQAYEKLYSQAEYYMQSFDTQLEHVKLLQNDFFNDRKLAFITDCAINAVLECDEGKLPKRAFIPSLA